jgi:4-amino-4-deoxy-L-arabinose transferase-like glycosyltransferase
MCPLASKCKGYGDLECYNHNQYMKKLWNVILAMSRATLLTIIAVAALGALMGYRLGNLTPGISEPELATYESANSLGEILDNPVNGPYKSTIYLVTRVFDNSFGLRLTGAVIGALSVVLFFLLARKIFNTMTVLSVTIMFATSSLLLHTARLATGEVMLLSLLALICAGFFVRFGRRPRLAWLLASAVIGLSLYVPGMVFFVAVAAAWQFRRVRGSFEQLQHSYIAASSALLSIICAPIIISLIRDFSLWRSYLGLPATFEPMIEMARNSLQALISIFVITPADPVHWLGQQPILDVFCVVLLCLGLLGITKQYKLDRLWALLGIFVMSIVWIGVTGNQWAIIILLPFLYLIIATGLQQFMNQWLDVFPQNPIARTTGRILLLAAVVLSVNFQLQRYFVAWPHADATKAAFTQTLPNKP